MGSHQSHGHSQNQIKEISIKLDSKMHIQIQDSYLSNKKFASFPQKNLNESNCKSQLIFTKLNNEDDSMSKIKRFFSYSLNSM